MFDFFNTSIMIFNMISFIFMKIILFHYLIWNFVHFKLIVQKHCFEFYYDNIMLFSFLLLLFILLDFFLTFLLIFFLCSHSSFSYILTCFLLMFLLIFFLCSCLSFFIFLLVFFLCSCLFSFYILACFFLTFLLIFFLYSHLSYLLTDLSWTSVADYIFYWIKSADISSSSLKRFFWKLFSDFF